MKRSNRLVLLVGVFLAIVAFVGILVLTRQPERRQTPIAPRPAPSSSPRSTSRSRRGSARTRSRPRRSTSTRGSPGAFTDVSQVVGQIARQQVATGGQITSATLTGGAVTGRSTTSTAR